ncbi:MAG: hypothetical protein ACM3KL_00590 [Alphaproteobacteria bacterium]
MTDSQATRPPQDGLVVVSLPLQRAELIHHKPLTMRRNLPKFFRRQGRRLQRRSGENGPQGRGYTESIREQGSRPHYSRFAKLMHQ